MERRTILKAMAVLGVAEAATLSAEFDTPLAVDRAQKVTEEWLARVDAGQYDASWEDAASFFQKSVQKDRWRRSMAETRKTLGALVSRTLRQRNQSPLAALFGMMALGLLLASVSDVAIPLITHDASALPGAAKKCGLVGAMALQNVVMRHALSSSCPTTVMTGNLTQFIIEFVELIAGRRSRERSERSLIRSKAEIRLRVLGTALGSFLVCAALAVFLTTTIGAVSLLLPTIAISVLAALELKSPTAVSRTGTLF